MNVKTYTITTDDAAQWRQVVPASVSVARSVEYVRISERQFGWSARLFVVETDRPVAAYPYFLRPVDALPFAAGAGWDTCTPEYTGPIWLDGGSVPRFSELFARHCRDHGIIAEFAHLDPWLPDGLVEPAGVQLDREIVYVDLTQSAEAVWTKSLTSDARRMTKKGREAGVQVRRATSADDVREFHRLYAGTMERRQALERYLFPVEYFLAFFETMPANSFFVLAECQGRTVAGGLFLHDATTIFWHLSAVDMEWHHARPVNIYTYETICQSLGQGWQRMILGGGYEPGDGVSRFKASLSPLRARFSTYRRVHDEARYAALTQAWRTHYSGAEPGSFFPAYRALPVRAPVREVAT